MLMSKNIDFENLVEELTYYKNLTELTSDCILKYGTLLEHAEAIRYCGTFVEVATVADNDGNFREKVTAANFCRERLCPMCQRRKSLKMYADVRRLVEYMTGSGWAHMVLTVRNVEAPEISETITRLYRNSSRLITKEPSFCRAFRGALRCLEVTYNSTDDTYHPHLHILLNTSKSYKTNKRIYIGRKKLRELWRTYAGLDYEPQVYIDANVNDGVLAEIAKYCVKPLQLDLPLDVRCEVLENLHEALHGRRLVQAYGSVKSALKDLKIDINADSDHELIADTEQMFVYNFDLSRYDNRVI